MFTSDVREAKQDEIKMEGVDPDALWVLVQYAYTGLCLSGRDVWLDIFTCTYTKDAH